MKENQNLEFKESWRDEYLKYISGFANTHGGTLLIGINDSGQVIGVKNAKELLENLPNKIVTTTGVVADVDLMSENGMEYIKVTIPQSTAPVSFKGKFYYRSGSTLQELNGIAAHDFIMKKMGITWDGQGVDSATLDDIDPEAVKYFIQSGIKNKRLLPSAENDSIKKTLSNLELFTKDGRLTMAALLLFGKNPQKYCISATFRIGYFWDDIPEVKTQDMIGGDLIRMADRVIEVLDHKYLVRPIHYEGMRRIEPLEIPEEGLREVLYNAIVHKDYRGTDIHLRVYPDRLRLSNEGELPEGYTMDVLYGQHESKPRNKLIAKAFFYAGFIENWGQGFDKIRRAFEPAGLELPTYENSCGCAVATIKRENFIKMKAGINDTKVDTKNSTNPNLEELTERQRFIYNFISDENSEDGTKTAKSLTPKLGVSISTVKRELKELQIKGYLEHIGPSNGGYWKVLIKK